VKRAIKVCPGKTIYLIRHVETLSGSREGKRTAEEGDGTLKVASPRYYQKGTFEGGGGEKKFLSQENQL